MAETNFAACLAFTLGEEGGFSDDPNDPGNWTGGAPGVGLLKGTNFGISAAAYPTLDIKGLTKADATAIYHRDYWTPAKCAAVPAGVDLVLFDEAVNAGDGREAKMLQQAVGVTVDGDIGPVTLGAVNKMAPADLIEAFSARRIAFYEAMADAAEYGQQLIARAKRCRTAALGMVKG